MRRDGPDYMRLCNTMTSTFSADAEIRGYRPPEDDAVMTIQVSSNHVEEIYENGHLFDVFFSKLPHQAFGNGPHFCLGAHMARRMGGQILLPKRFERFPNMQLTDPKDVIFLALASGDRLSCL